MALKQVEDKAQHVREDSQQAERNLDEHTGYLGSVFGARPGWKNDLLGNPPAFAGEVKAQVDSWRRAFEERKAVTAQIDALRNDLAGGEAQEKERRAHLDQSEEQLRQTSSWVAALVEERRGILGGKAVIAVQKELELAVTNADQQHVQAADAQLEAQLRLVRIEEQENQAQGACDKARQRLQQAKEQRDQALAEAEIPVDLVLRHLDKASGWIRETQAVLEQSRLAQQQADVVLSERIDWLNRHLAGGRPPIDEAEVDLELVKRDRQIEEITQQRVGIEVELLRDDHGRQEQNDLLRQIADQQMETGYWNDIGDLIGSADGDKFSRYAQSLTLDCLLAEANQHLADLAPRFRLMRVPASSGKAQLDLQVVDGEMGDDIRGVRSLSGGESFLVSLALALGLSSLSSRRLSIESLFIDEGFGSLDPITLDIAMHALDLLQSRGRQVGVISHVPGLAERIGAQIKVIPQGGGRSRVCVER